MVLLILTVAIVLAATMAISLFILRGVGDKAERRADELRAEVDSLGESWVIPLEGAVYERGPGAHGDRGHGVLGLTGRRLLFLPIAGQMLSVPRVRLAGACLEDRRRDSASRHRHHLVLTLDDGCELGFLVDDVDEWTAALGSAATDETEAAGSARGAAADPPPDIAAAGPASERDPGS